MSKSRFRVKGVSPSAVNSGGDELLYFLLTGPLAWKVQQLLISYTYIGVPCAPTPIHIIYMYFASSREIFSLHIKKLTLKSTWQFSRF